jgi:crossover junction endodeoxyribonuclease RuvC
LPANRVENQVSSDTILGVDPGGQVTGFGVIRRGRSVFEMLACGVSRARRGETTAEKLSRVFHFTRERIEQYSPCCLVVEDVFFGKNVQSLKVICQVRGVIILAGALSGLPVHEYSPREVKKSVVGRGDASKEQVQQMIKTLLSLEKAPEPNDAADALAVALCHAHRPNYFV